MDTQKGACDSGMGPKIREEQDGRSDMAPVTAGRTWYASLRLSGTGGCCIRNLAVSTLRGDFGAHASGTRQPLLNRSAKSWRKCYCMASANSMAMPVARASTL